MGKNKRRKQINQDKNFQGSGIFVNDYDPDSETYATKIRELSISEKEHFDFIAECEMDKIWKPDDEFLEETFYIGHMGLIHLGHEYFITFDKDDGNNTIWVIYDRDYSNPKYRYNIFWETEPRADYPTLQDLLFNYKLKNDGRTIAEYICDFQHKPRLLMPEEIIPAKYRKKILNQEKKNGNNK